MRLSHLKPAPRPLEPFHLLILHRQWHHQHHTRLLLLIILLLHHHRPPAAASPSHPLPRRKAPWTALRAGSSAAQLAEPIAARKVAERT